MSGKRYKHTIDCDEVLARIKAGESVRSISIEVGCSAQTIYKRLQKHKKGKYGKGTAMETLDRYELRKLRESGLTLREIAERYDSSPATIFRLVGHKHKQGSSVVELIKSDGDPIAIRADQIGFIEKLSDSPEAAVTIFTANQRRHRFIVLDYDDAVERWHIATYGNDKKGEV